MRFQDYQVLSVESSCFVDWRSINGQEGGCELKNDVDLVIQKEICGPFYIGYDSKLDPL